MSELHVAQANIAWMRYPFEDPRILFNMSVWESVERLFDYVYAGLHGEYFARHKEWFAKPEHEPGIVMWYIAVGSTPTVDEAKERFERLWRLGPTPDALTFRDAYNLDGAPLPRSWRRDRVREP